MKLWQSLIHIKGFPVLLAALAVGLILLIFPFSSPQKTTVEVADDEVDFSAYEEELAHKIKQMAGALTGDRNASVLLTLDVTRETVYATESTVNGETQYSTKYLLSDGEPVETHIILPRIRGIAVVCKGGDDASVRLALISMLTAAFDIPASRVYVGASHANAPDF